MHLLSGVLFMVPNVVDFLTFYTDIESRRKRAFLMNLLVRWLKKGCGPVDV